MSFSRRQLFQYAGAGGALLGIEQVLGPKASNAASALARAAVEPRYTYDPAPFCLGVASGDPLPDGIVLWTRLVPKPRQTEQGLASLVPVRWQLASDESFSTVVRSGTFQANSSIGHSVHVDVRGLQPGTTYWYRFNALGVDSPVGRTRTAPAVDAANQSIRFASGNCQSISDTLWYPAWRDIAADDDLDFVVHLGDYIYESSGTSLATYRGLHETYKGDRDLRDAHRRHPFYVTWDDHEVVNDYSGRPASLPASFLARRTNAYRAWYEHMPVRLAPGDSLSDFKIHQQRRWGTLMDITILDLRQYRSAQNLANGTIVGAAQKQWFLDNITQPDTGWQTVCNSIMFSKLEKPAGGSYYFTDQWDGFIAERKQVTQALKSSAAKDVVFITGDWHSAFVCDVYADFAVAPGASNPVVATEFVAHSITSGAYDAATNARLKGEFATRNPHIKDFEGDHYGYDLYEVTPTEWVTHQRVVATRSDRLAPVTTLQSWVVERGRAGAVKV